MSQSVSMRFYLRSFATYFSLRLCAFLRLSSLSPVFPVVHTLCFPLASFQPSLLAQGKQVILRPPLNKGGLQGGRSELQEFLSRLLQIEVPELRRSGQFVASAHKQQI